MISLNLQIQRALTEDKKEPKWSRAFVAAIASKINQIRFFT